MKNEGLLNVILMVMAAAWLWGAIQVIDLGFRWHSTQYVRHGVSVVLNDGQKMVGDLSMTWGGDERLSLDDGATIILPKDYQMLTIPKEGQEPRGVPYMGMLALLCYLILSAFGIPYLAALLFPNLAGRLRSPSKS
ncbi:hypothetical protein V0242_25580 (plasmid) [Aeromonas hydrophila]|uniref:hypothetical protein n=1 Tax=Aeromonas hydrophila TaxID=644 RepID=UPI002ED107B4|nr:hypothetical protein V0242_25580 [Aeromonas hydrophila]